MSAKFHVLLLINEEGHARELSRVSDYLIKASDLQPVFFVEHRMKPHDLDLKLATGSVEVLTADQIAGLSSHKPMTIKGFFRRGANDLISTLLFYWGKYFAYFGTALRISCQEIVSERNRLLQHSMLCAAVFSQRPYAAIVLSEDNVDLDSSVWIKVAAERGVRSIILPYTMAATVEFLEAYVYSAPSQVTASPGNQIIARLFPRWRARHKGRDFIRPGYARIAAFELLGLTPPNPWLLNSGHADAIAVESVAMYDYYRTAGLPADRLVVTGSFADDVLSAVCADAPRRRQELLTEAGLPSDRPILLCAFPPDDNRYDRPGVEFRNFDEQLVFWGTSLAAIHGWNVIVVPHPKTRIERLDALQKLGLTLSRRDTASLIPLCDLYVASASATIRWALACGKPVINYDVFQLDFLDYDHLDGVTLARTRKDFQQALASLTSDSSEYPRIMAIQAREAPRWGFGDGQSGQRLLALIRGEHFTKPTETAAIMASAASRVTTTLASP